MQPSSVIMSNETHVHKTIAHILADGSDAVRILADFDKTLTTAFVDGHKTGSTIAQLRNGKFLTPTYAPRAHALFDEYHPIEIDPHVSVAEKKQKMHAWRKKHLALLIECWLTRDVLDTVIAQKTLRFRDKATEFFETLHRKRIPLCIVSAGIGDMIRGYLEQENFFFDNVHLISNLLQFDATGKVTGVQEPIIHSANKADIYHIDIHNRKNVILLGDTLEDVAMLQWLSYEHVVKIWFLNHDVEKLLEYYKKTFDVVITNDGSLERVVDILTKISV